jgi:hypothetical protein
LAWFASACLR